MKQLLVLSGKGGTGKTTVAGAFIRLAEAEAYADCDVDAPNLHLIAGELPLPKLADYYGMDKAVINAELCTECGLCLEHCRFGAIKFERGYRVDPYACEGCSVCQLVCPAKAVELVPALGGELRLYKSDVLFSTAQLKMGSGNSGLLVTEVKKRLQEVEEGVPLAIIDGSPGIGCPVHASLSGVDLVLLVTEPSLSGLSDLQRIMDTAFKFSIKQVACINKFDTNLELTEKIIQLCKDRGVPVVGKIPFDPRAHEAVNAGRTIVDVPCAAGDSVRGIFRETMRHINSSIRGKHDENSGTK